MNVISGKSKHKQLKLLLGIVVLITFLIGFFQFEENAEKDAAKPSQQHEISLIQCDVPSTYHLPVYVIETLGKEIPIKSNPMQREINGRTYTFQSSSEKIDAIVKQYRPNEHGQTCIFDVTQPTTVDKISINVRGQSSFLNPKKQYTIRYVDEGGNEKKVDLEGMGAHDKWVLNGSYLDRTSLRNYLASMMGQVMEYTPQAEFVEIFIDMDTNGVIEEEDYIGLYLLMEKIERGNERVDIVRGDEKFKDVSFIIARDKIKFDDEILDTDWGFLEEDYVIDSHGKTRFKTVITPVYPSGTKLTEAYETRIVNYLNSYEYALYSNFFMDRKKGYRNYIDVDSFVQYAMINEVFKNIDGGDVSTYFYKDVGGLMKAGPIWDFDQTLGNTIEEEVNEPTGYRTVNALWFERLFQDPRFTQRYKELYEEYRSDLWSDESIDHIIDEALEYLGPAISRNEKRWYASQIIDYKTEVEKMRQFLHARLAWMDDNIDLVKRTLKKSENN